MRLSNEDQTFLKTYDDSKYAKPSVTADMVIFSRFSDGSLQVLLIRRGKSPYKDQFALPGGFVNPDESVDQAARRELLEETGVDCACLEPIRTFSTPGRDPRRWVISCAYLALLDASKLQVKAADDAKDARWFQIFLTMESGSKGHIFHRASHHPSHLPGNLSRKRCLTPSTCAASDSAESRKWAGI